MGSWCYLTILHHDIATMHEDIILFKFLLLSNEGISPYCLTLIVYYVRKKLTLMKKACCKHATYYMSCYRGSATWMTSPPL